jgi:phosphatidylinositol kinase/protein kinase (PI-3  family)
MCGYVLGLGDRHNGNILLDNTTAEIIHIDLGSCPSRCSPRCSFVLSFFRCRVHKESISVGVAFDLGKFLKTPEIVPFRFVGCVVLLVLFPHRVFAD